MHWQEAARESKISKAYRVDKDGNVITRDSNGDAFIVYKTPPLKTHKLESWKVDGYIDWLPAKGDTNG